MKKVLLSFVAVLLFIMAFATTADQFKLDYFNADPVIGSGTKDSLAIANGAKSMCLIQGGRPIMPGGIQKMAWDPTSNYIQLILGACVDEVTPLFSGVYYASNDAGANWTAGLDLYPANHSVSRALTSMDITPDGYPYAVSIYREASGDRQLWFTADGIGPNGGGWNTPFLVSDPAVDLIVNYETVAVNALGDKVVVFGYDNYWNFGVAYSTDYGQTFSAWTEPAALNPDSIGVYANDVSTIRWGDGDNVFCLYANTPMANAAVYDYGGRPTFGLITSPDAGATWGALEPIFGTEWWPEVPALNGDTLRYMLDTIANGTPDTAYIKAWVDMTQGFWVDEIGYIDAAGFEIGSWWHYWDMEFVDDGTDQFLFFSLPYHQLTVDYVDEGDLYTFHDNWGAIMFGYRDIGAGATDYNWDFIDIHAPVIDTFGNLETYRGIPYTTQLSYDSRDGSVYIVYMDLYDTLTVAGSHELIKINDGVILRATVPPVLNSGVSNAMAAPKFVDGDGLIHTAFRPDTEDSIYYINLDVDNVASWDTLGTTTYGNAGITSDREITNASAFEVPSIVKDFSKISFTLSSSSRVEITLYDVTGREIRSLANNTFTKGTHTVNLNAGDLTTGIYFAKIKSDDLNSSKKVIIVR